MKTVAWRVPSQVTADSFRKGSLDKSSNGGEAYYFQAMQALKESFAVEIDPSSVRMKDESFKHYIFKLWQSKTEADVFIRDAKDIALGPGQLGERDIGLIHHLEYNIRDNSIKYRWYFNRLIRQLKKLPMVVTVSTYWKNELHNLGCENVEIIYNSFDLEEFNIADEQMAAFRKRFGLPEGKPLIYIGNASPQKGVIEVYEALKHSDYSLVMTGASNVVDLPVPWFSFDREDYICLLKSCDVVLTMSTLLEGWNRVAHEAMLCRTPVIGTGVAGMRELLEGGEQIIVDDTENLPEYIEMALRDKDELSTKGYAFAKKFDVAYFNDAWNSIVHQTLDS